MGTQPISEASPAGEDPRENDTYAAAQSQIDRLTDIHAQGGVDWGIVAASSQQILGREGKDLTAAVWLTLAGLHLQGTTGLAAGVHILNDLIHTYWDTMFPPPARLRGRRNQIQWLLDQLNERLQGEFDAVPPETHGALLTDWDALDEFWQSKDTDPPAIFGLRRLLASLPVLATAEPTPAPPATAAEAAPQAGAASATPAAAPPAQTATAPAPLAATVAPASGADPTDAIDAALTGMQPLIDWCLEQNPALPLLFRLNRICAWASISAAPPATGIATLLPAPPDQLVTGLAQVMQGTEPQAIVHFVEARLIGQRYWLDLNRICHAALTRMGAQDAAAVVAFETASFLARLPQLATLTFNDGRPFADAETRAWLDSLAASAGPGSQGGADPIDTLAGTANAAAAAGQLDAALASLQAATGQTASARDAFRLKLAQCSLLYSYDTSGAVRTLLAPLIQELDVYRLSLWEPGLARQALELAAAVEQRYGTDPGETSAPMLARLAGLDCHAAWRLSQTSPTS
ncbi:type VI secretion system ImpA domain-containing protein [Candidimonas nitroreducens]|uniref:Type VI secretion system ImpA domain-containing protein n=1 Tax=Candidimonas nitroreducens TaxID=683354 RepID=A0A225MKA8_9BURK|nr:type VI secretion system ImpA domain-containing protein [Candidimonas nitroreducens]